MSYRFLGKQRTITFGRWRELLLGEARERLLDARRLLAKGVDPVERAKLETIEKMLAAAHTFEAVANEWLEKIAAEGAAAMTLKKARWLLARLYPAIGKRPIREVSAHELLLALKKIEATKRYDAANRACATSSLHYAIATARAERDSASDLRGALFTPRTTHRATIPTPIEASAKLRATDEYDGYHSSAPSPIISLHWRLRRWVPQGRVVGLIEGYPIASDVYEKVPALRCA